MSFDFASDYPAYALMLVFLGFLVFIIVASNLKKDTDTKDTQKPEIRKK